MKHFLLKFNYGVEIGAELAYRGHYQRTSEPYLLRVIEDERKHQQSLDLILKIYNQKPSAIINVIFGVIGITVYALCQVSPRPLLNFVARSLETFAVFSYSTLAKRYPEFEKTFLKMAKQEKAHEVYFKGGLVLLTKEVGNDLL